MHSLNDTEIIFLPAKFEGNKTGKSDKKWRQHDIKYTVNKETSHDSLEDTTEIHDVSLDRADTNDKVKLLNEDSIKTDGINGEINVNFDETELDEVQKDDAVGDINKKDENSEDEDVSGRNLLRQPVTIHVVVGIHWDSQWVYM